MKILAGALVGLVVFVLVTAIVGQLAEPANYLALPASLVAGVWSGYETVKRITRGRTV
ncbi:MAG: hypothetical protein AB7Q01_08610 [Gammaproteobacteria bacterium]